MMKMGTTIHYKLYKREKSTSSLHFNNTSTDILHTNYSEENSAKMKLILVVGLTLLATSPALCYPQPPSDEEGSRHYARYDQYDRTPTNGM